MAIVALLIVLIYYVQKISKISEISTKHCRQQQFSAIPLRRMPSFVEEKNPLNKFTIKNSKKYSDNFYKDFEEDSQRYVAEPSVRPGIKAQQCLKKQIRPFSPNDEIFCTRNSHRMFFNTEDNEILMSQKIKHAYKKLNVYRDGVEDAERIYEEIDQNLYK